MRLGKKKETGIKTPEDQIELRDTSLRYEEAKGQARPNLPVRQAGTEAKEVPVPLYSNGCPKCGNSPLVTSQKLPDNIRICRCRVCCWKGMVTG